MTKKTRSYRPSPALIISCVAVFLALTGSALAAGIARNSVRSAQIADGTVRIVDLHDGSVTTPKIGLTAVGNEQLADNAVTSAKVADQSLSGADIAPDSIRATQLGTITQRNITTTIKANSTGSVSADCEPGEQIISGGGQPSVFSVEMVTSRPSGNGWLYQAKNGSATDQTITAFALCLVQ
ncbi:MAG: hypothetical protein H0X42_03125 [Solirubrobacterales bacterium]|nr:hypothetical protein [Solirubrobacterales bacterium]